MAVYIFKTIYGFSETKFGYLNYYNVHVTILLEKNTIFQYLIGKYKRVQLLDQNNKKIK